MDITLEAGIIGAAAALLGAVIGGLFALVGAERAMNGTLLTAEEDRQARYVASLEAAAREAQLNEQQLNKERRLMVWQSLRSPALDRLFAAPDWKLPDVATDAVVKVTEYNALAEMSQQLFQSGHPIPPELQTHLEQVAPQVAEQLKSLSDALKKSAAQPIGEQYGNVRRARLERYPKGLRWWGRLVTPRETPQDPVT